MSENSVTAPVRGNPADGTGQPPDKEMKDITIVVNGREKTVSTKELSFDALVALAFEDPPTGEFICFTITFRRGQGNKPEGSLAEDETVKLKDGMIFNVSATDKS